jgi:polyisoprenoid-binding protein YceI
LLRWNFDPAYSTVEFAVRNLWYTVHGRFRVVEGAILLDQSDLRHSSVDATIKASSIDTGNKRRDAHLQTRDFLDTDRFPEIRFRSTKIERGKDRDSIDLEGELTINDRTRTIALAVNEMDRSRSPRGEEYVYYSATTELDRFDFGIDYGSAIIGRKLRVTINVQASS